MIGNLLVGIALKFTGVRQGVADMEALDIATKRAALSLAMAKKEIGGVDAALARNALTMESIAVRQQRAMERTAATAARTRAMVAGAFAVGGAAGIVSAIKAAADFQLAMTSVRAATGASNSELAKMARLVMQTSGFTAQSSTTIASEMAAAATAGLNQPGRLQTAFPQLAKAADVMMLSPKQIPPIEAVTQLAKLSHLFGAYSGKPFHDMVDAATRLMYSQPENLAKLINQGRLFIPIAMSAGVPMADIFKETMTMGQTGLLTGRGGSGLSRYIEFMGGAESITSHLSKVRRAALTDLGIFGASGQNRFIDKQGRFELEASLKYLSDVRKTMTPVRFAMDVYNALQQQGGVYALAVTRPEVMAQRLVNQRSFNQFAPPGQAVDVMWNLYTKNLLFQWQNFTTNFSNLAQVVFLPTLPALTEFFKNFADILHKVTGFFEDHRDLGFGVAVGAMSAVATSAVLATANLIALNRAILSISASSGVGAASGTTGVFARWLPLLGRISFTLSALYALDNAKATGKKGTPAGEPSWAGLSGMSRDQIRDYIHRTGWGNIAPDVREHWRNVLNTTGGASGFIRTGRHPAITGGQAFDEDRLRRTMHQNVSLPIVGALTGAGGLSVTDSIARASRQTSDPIVHALGPKLDAIVTALSSLGINITIPASPGHPAQTIHQFLSKGGAPLSRGNPSHPLKGAWQGFSR